MCNVSLSLIFQPIKMPKATQKSVTTGEDLEEVDEDIPLHGTINEEEARAYRESLDKVFDDIATNIEDCVTKAMELAIIDLKTEIVKQIPGTEEVDTRSILKLIQDPSCLAMREQTEEVIAKLKEVLPESDTTSSKEVIESMTNWNP